jgi:peptidoglycan-associated lipoprotein
MKINSIKILGSILVISLLTACSSKEETISYNDNNINKTNVKEKVDNKISSIKTVQSEVIENEVSSISKSSEFNEVISNINGVTVKLTSIHFAFDNYKMTEEMTKITNNNTKVIEPILVTNKNIKIKLEGNCDEWGTDEYNFALGLKRAKTVKNALINNGIKSSDIIVVSLGESNPLCNDQTKSCWKKNRRVDHKLLP